MPIGPIGQSPIDRKLPENNTGNSANAPGKPFPQSNAASSSETQPPTPVTTSPAAMATQLVQNARAGNASLAPALHDLINAQMAQMGLPPLPKEQQQTLVSQLAEDPVVKGLIGKLPRELAP